MEIWFKWYYLYIIKQKSKFMKNRSVKFVLLENGYVHTSGLSKADALEMLERYQRIFPEMEWAIQGRSIIN